jgi:hypothetical protein
MQTYHRRKFVVNKNKNPPSAPASAVGGRLEKPGSALLRGGRCRQRHLGAAMARKARNVLLPIAEGHVDLTHHLHHHPSGFFLWVLIAVELALHMAVGALHAQSGCEVPHHVHNSGAVHSGRKDLQVLRWATAAFLFLSLTTERDHRESSKR